MGQKLVVSREEVKKVYQFDCLYCGFVSAKTLQDVISRYYSFMNETQMVGTCPKCGENVYLTVEGNVYEEKRGD